MKVEVMMKEILQFQEEENAVVNLENAVVNLKSAENLEKKGWLKLEKKGILIPFKDN